MKYQTLGPTDYLRALLREREHFELAGCGRAVVPQAWQWNRGFDRRGLEDSLLYGIESGSLAVETPVGEGELGERCLLWTHGGLATRFVVPDGIESTSVRWFRFRLGGVRPLRLRRRLFVTRPTPEGLDQLDALLALHQAGGDLSGLRLRMALGQLLCLILRESEQPGSTPGLLKRRQRTACLDFIHANLHRFFPLSEVAAACGLNPAYLSAQFTRTFGHSLQAYVKTARIREARSLLLDTDLRVGEVAQALGYRDMYYFSRQFKDVTGLSPRAWRARGADR